MTATLPATIEFEDTTFDVVERNGQPWLRLPQIGAALGFENQYHAQKLYSRNRDEFTDAETAVVTLATNGGRQKVRIFSARGAWLLGMLARTERAKEFRRWVLDVLEEHKPVTVRSYRRAMPVRRAHDGVFISLPEAMNLAALVNLLPHFKAPLREVEEGLRRVRSPLAPQVFDAWHETSTLCRTLGPLVARCQEALAGQKMIGGANGFMSS